MRAAALLALALGACASSPASRPPAELWRTYVGAAPCELVVVDAAQSGELDALAAALDTALAVRGLRSTPKAARSLTIRLVALDTSLLRAASAVEVAFEVVTSSSPEPVRWGPRVVRLQNHAASYQLKPYLAEALGRLLDAEITSS